MLWILVPVFFVIREQGRSYSLVGLFCILAATITAVLVFRPQFFFRAVRFAARAMPKKFREKFLAFGSRGLEAFSVLRSPRTLAALALLTFVFILGQVLTNFFVMKACGLHLPVYAALFILLGVQVGYVVPSAPGKIGIFEYSVILSLSAFPVQKNSALSYALGPSRRRFPAENRPGVHLFVHIQAELAKKRPDRGEARGLACENRS